MKSRRSALARLGVVFWATASLVACLPIARADAESAGPTVHVNTSSAQVGQLIQVTGTGWSPVGQTVQIELCGQNAINLSNDCDQTHQYTAAIRAGGIFYGALVTQFPPSPCPCVVAVSNEGAFSAVLAPITIIGARTVAVPSQAPPAAPVALSAKVLTDVSAASWFGGPRSVTLVLRVKNVAPIAFGSPTLTVNVGRGRNPSGFVVGKPLAPLAVGATQVLRIPVTLPAFTAGDYSVRAQVITGQGEVATVAGTSSYPWGLFIVAALVIQTVLLAVRNRVRTRLRRPTDVEAPEEDVLVPVAVIDLRAPGAEVPVPVADLVDSSDGLQVGEAGGDALPEPVPAIDLRTPTAAPAGAWTSTNRLAIELPGQSLTWTVEVSACPAIMIQRTTVRAWADFAASPWDAVHEVKSWAEMAAGSPSNALVAGGTFRYDSRSLELELRVSAMGPRLELGNDRLVVPVRVEGSITFNGERAPVDIEATLEQTWDIDSGEDSSSDDLERPARPLSYGHTIGGDSFYLQVDSDGAPSGWLVRGGLAASIVHATRRVEEQFGAYPRRVTVDLSDELGRRLHASGKASNGMASRQNDRLVLECRTEWDVDGSPAVGEDRSSVDVAAWRTATRPGWREPADASS